MSAEISRHSKAIQLISDNYNFKRDYATDKKMYWKCITPQCQARATTCLISDTDTSIEFLKKGIHNHPAPDNKPQWQIVLNELLQTHQMVKPAILINKLHTRCFTMPAETIIRQRINYYRTKNNISKINILSTNIKALKLLTSESKNFTLYDDNLGQEINGRIVIFGSPFNVRRLATFKAWMCDGTFEICPIEFQQLFTIKAKVYNIWLPLIYCLMENRVHIENS